PAEGAAHVAGRPASKRDGVFRPAREIRQVDQAPDGGQPLMKLPGALDVAALNGGAHGDGFARKYARGPGNRAVNAKHERWENQVVNSRVDSQPAAEVGQQCRESLHVPATLLDPDDCRIV